MTSRPVAVGTVLSTPVGARPPSSWALNVGCAARVVRCARAGIRGRTCRRMWSILAAPEFSGRTGNDDLRAGRIPMGQSVRVRRRWAIGRSGLAVLVLATAGGASLSDCSSTSCTAEARFSLRVIVLGSTGKQMCDASVIATDGSFSAPLSNFPDRGSCWYSGVAERAGTYTLVVRFGPMTKTLDGVKVTADACHVRTRDVSITLDS
ncbi:MAG: hypothetical protein QOE62_1260 [Actinomycetota bacterium]|nr:hypothetical protein [Actinomycetota bacterium]